MLTIRLMKTGKRNNSSFRVVLIEKTAAPKSGNFLEILGNYNPHNKEINFKEERIKHWLSQGAKASETVHNLLIKKGVIKGSKIKKNIKKKKSNSETGQEYSGNKEDNKEKKEIQEEKIKEVKKEEKQEIEQKEDVVKEEEGLTKVE
ncbi:MAG: 30S ribosomal protein S16 [Candidatus Atribacteria bacterium]|nr:30S ribosomal protein S16 [Candidatus Atribacteria bacterium]